MKLQTIISTNPGRNYEKIGEVAISSNEQILEKVDKARHAQPAWAALGIKKRIAFLEHLYQKFVTKKDAIILLASKEMGMPIRIAADIDIKAGLLYMRGYLDNAQQWLEREVLFENDQEIHYLFFEPKGVVGISVPWNFPFCNFIWAVMQNLVVGNSIVFKHSEECPLTGKLLEDIVASVHLPEGVFNQVYGDGASVGEYLMNSNIDHIFFTGSTGVGKHLYQVAAKKWITATLELGGSAPGIIFEDADINLALESVYFNRFVNSGQSCDGLKRLIVHRSCFQAVIDKLTTILMTKKIGDPQDITTDIGPLVAQRQLTLLEEQVADAREKGAKIVVGGKRPTGLEGAFYEPTILIDITRTMRVWQQEVFGPVLPIVVFDTEQEALALANDTMYGLGAYIYTGDHERALRVAAGLNTGNVSINNANYCIPQDPFGGYKNSGLGREHGKLGLRELCSAKVVAIKKTHAHREF